MSRVQLRAIPIQHPLMRLVAWQFVGEGVAIMLCGLSIIGKRSSQLLLEFYRLKIRYKIVFLTCLAVLRRRNWNPARVITAEPSSASLKHQGNHKKFRYTFYCQAIIHSNVRYRSLVKTGFGPWSATLGHCRLQTSLFFQRSTFFNVQISSQCFLSQLARGLLINIYKCMKLTN